MAEICYEIPKTDAIFPRKPLTAATFSRNAGNRRYFSTKYPRFRVFSRRSTFIVEKNSSKISTRDSKDEKET